MATVNRWKIFSITPVILVTILGFWRSATAADDDTQQWTEAKIRYAVDHQISLSLASRVRFDEGISRAKDLLIRPSVELALIPPFSFGLGYDHIHPFPSGSSSENRVWQQAGFKFKLGDLSVGNWVRVEERFIEDIDGAIVRARYRLHLTHPIGVSSWTLIGSEEVFVNLNSKGTGPVCGFEQNRLFGGLGRKVGEHLWVEAGYQWGFEEERDAPNQNIHAILVNFSYDF